MIHPNTPIEKLKFVGPKMMPKLKRLNINTIKDLLWHFPHRYEDYSQYITIDKITIGEKINIRGVVKEIANQRTWKRRMTITTALIDDGNGSINAVWFNQPYLTNTIRVGFLLNLSGKTALRGKEAYIQNPNYEIVARVVNENTPIKINQENLKHTGRLIPIYPETEGLTSRYLRMLVKSVFRITNRLVDYLPSEITKRQNLVNIRSAIKEIHFPTTIAESEKARERLAFDELFFLQLKALRGKHKLKIQKAYPVAFNKKLIKEFLTLLPFQLTGAQKLALWEIIQDIEKPHPMNRLLNGDVGSGKTIVALIAALETIRVGYKAIFMAPTEVLAIQHFNTTSSLLGHLGIKIAILTSSKKLINDDGHTIEAKKGELINQINSGDIDLIIGTHALLQENVKPSKAALMIIDEQHRFGVEQRARLLKNNRGTMPHLLSMSATPIPRTLALTIYGDLDISILNEMPKGRKKITTKVVKPKAREQTYEFIRERVKRKEQVFVICPRIEPTPPPSLPGTASLTMAPPEQQTFQLTPQERLDGEVKAVKSEYEKLAKKTFPNLKVVMLHGKMKSKEKEEIMKKFKNKECDIMVATSVIEVGVDIPDATIMMIEGAEKFGLAQLHQFRGRVGRSDKQSYCLLFVESPEIESTRRLAAMEKYSSGFKLAEMDLKIRGPGEFMGKEQSGMPDLTMASLADMGLIKKARSEAQLVISKGLQNYPILVRKLKEFQSSVHLE